MCRIKPTLMLLFWKCDAFIEWRSLKSCVMGHVFRSQVLSVWVSAGGVCPTLLIKARSDRDEKSLASETETCMMACKQRHAKLVCLLEFYVLATSTVISGWVPTCDSEHSQRLYSAAPLISQSVTLPVMLIDELDHCLMNLIISWWIRSFPDESDHCLMNQIIVWWIR